MNCDEIRPLYSPYLDSELDAKTIVEIHRHLDACADCARALSLETQVDRQLMASLKKGERSEELWQRIEQRVIAAGRSKPNLQPTRSRPPTLAGIDWLLAQFSSLLWPHPKAWAGLAAVWLLLLFVHRATQEPSPMLEANQTAARSPEVLHALRHQEQLFVELLDLRPSPNNDKSDAKAPGPRTQRHLKQPKA